MEGITIVDQNGRMSGGTTRTVDLAVQRLFELGEIYIPKQIHISKESFRGRNPRTIIIDPSWDASPHVQNRLFDLISNRLKAEHFRVPIKRNDRVLFINDEKYVRHGV